MEKEYKNLVLGCQNHVKSQSDHVASCKNYGIYI